MSRQEIQPFVPVAALSDLVVDYLEFETDTIRTET
jgi:hypothetical protein